MDLYIYTKRGHDESGEFKQAILVLHSWNKFYVDPEDQGFFADQGKDEFEYDKPLQLDTSGVVLDAFKEGSVEIKPLVTVYDQMQNYGGPQEGGWYWHSKRATAYSPADVGLRVGSKEHDLDSHREGYYIKFELVRGSEEVTQKPNWW